VNLLGTDKPQNRTFRIPLTLTPAQRHIDQNFRRFTIVRAGRKFGKTTYSHKKALEWLGPPNSVHWQISPTYKSGKLISWQEFKRIIPPEAMKRKPNDTDLTITLKNGSQLYLMGSDEPDTLRGPAPTSVTFEEAALHKREVWHEVIRPNLLPHKAPALFIGTPKGYNWMKDLEDEARASIARGEKDWAIFHYSVYDNPHISREEIEQARLMCDNPAVWNQEYLANYESSVGRVFNSFSDERHIGIVPVPRGIPCYRAIDWGQRDDTACLWGYLDGPVLKIYREHAENGLPPNAQAELLLNKTESGELIEQNIIGHDAVKQDMQMQGLSVLWHFNQAGIRPIRPSSKDKKSSRAMLGQLIRENRLLIDRSCVKLRKQLLSYEWKDTIMEKTADGAVDCVDSLHYLVELLQFKLFLTPHKDDLSERERAVAEYQKAKAELLKPKWKIEPRETLNEFKFEDSCAGYFQ
jgi:hypothetical protein